MPTARVGAPAETATEELDRLARDYERARQAYLELEEQWRAVEAASRSGGSGRVRFTVLQSATAPQTPFFPNPVLFALAGAVLGLSRVWAWLSSSSFETIP